MTNGKLEKFGQCRTNVDYPLWEERCEYHLERSQMDVAVGGFERNRVLHMGLNDPAHKSLRLSAFNSSRRP
ncbi:hypothetical protein L596_016014 [Steinernema carpocapsae]|uniref:Uncharacterized protein n=1 Tax=Steinernema carpocapsae TaxID=34508 RepID=A0A4U5NGU9_STECR|nr:hypothetical protein L596_016014 [Steinernema carpocapsae]